MVRAECSVIQTNRARYRDCKWPQYFVAVPRVGEWAQTKGDTDFTALKVVRVIHCADPLDGYSTQPYIKVELGGL